MPAALAVPYGPYLATVLEIHDGDTGRFSLSLGFGVSIQESIRIYGINSPELHTGTAEQKAAGAAAREFLKALLPPGTVVRVTPGRTKQVMTFARYVAEVEYLKPDGTVGQVAEAMVGAGMARYCDPDLEPLPGPPPPMKAIRI